VRKAFREVARHRNATAPSLLACLTDSQARPIAAGHPALPPPVIAELLTDDDWRVVEAAAANPSLPPAVMSELVRSVTPVRVKSRKELATQNRTGVALWRGCDL
jgi:hypothetical protein